MKPVRFHSEAQIELTAEAQYYEERAKGLGTRFLGEVKTALSLVSTFPRIGAPYGYGARRVFPPSFPLQLSTWNAQTSGSFWR